MTYKTIVSCGFSSTSQDKSIHSLELYLDIPLKIIGQLHDFPLIVPYFSVLFHNFINDFQSCSYDVLIFSHHFPILFL